MESKEELRKRLTPIQYQVTQEAGTERPFTGKYNKLYEKGVYKCIVCREDLFTSDTKYDSGCGWPAFNDVLEQGKVTLHRDASIAGNNPSIYWEFLFGLIWLCVRPFVQLLNTHTHTQNARYFASNLSCK